MKVWSTAVGGKSVRSTRFVSIGAGTSGTVTLPSNSSVVLDDFGGTVDAVVTQISGGKPTQIPALTAAGVVVSTTFDTSGNWVFSGTPSSYPVAIVYRVSQSLYNYDSNSTDIWGEAEFHSVLPVADGGTGASTASTARTALGAATSGANSDITSLSSLSTPLSVAQGGTAGTSAATARAALGLAKRTSGTATSMWATSGTEDGEEWWNTTYKALFRWTNDRWWPTSDVDPRYGFVFPHEDFTGADRIGTLDWSGNNGQLAAGATSPGQVSISQSAASGISRMSGQLNTLQLGTADIWIEATLKIPTLSNGTDNACFVFGLSDISSYSATGACTDGAYFTLDPVNVNWLTNTSNNTSLSSKTSSTAPNADTFYRLSIFVQGSTSVTFYVGTTAITAAHTTQIPTGANRQTGINFSVNKTLGSGALSMTVDSFDGWVMFNGARVA